MARQLCIALLLALYCACCLACKTKTGTRTTSKFDKDGWNTDSETRTETDSGIRDWNKRSVGVAMVQCMKSEFMAGLRRSDSLDYLSKVACRTHNKGESLDVVYADWTASSGSNDQWSQCPSGYFLQGFFHSGRHYVLSDIKRGRCVRAVSQPEEYGQCHELDVDFLDAPAALCEADHYITALYRGSCEDLSCLKKLRCCKMA